MPGIEMFQRPPPGGATNKKNPESGGIRKSVSWDQGVKNDSSEEKEGRVSAQNNHTVASRPLPSFGIDNDGFGGGASSFGGSTSSGFGSFGSSFGPSNTQNAPAGGGGGGIAMFQKRRKEPEATRKNEMPESPPKATMMESPMEESPQDQGAPFGGSRQGAGIPMFAHHKPRANHHETQRFGDATAEESLHESSNLAPRTTTMDDNRSPTSLPVAPMGGLGDMLRKRKVDALANTEPRQQEATEMAPSNGALPFMHNMSNDAQAQNEGGIAEIFRSRKAAAAMEPTNHHGGQAATLAVAPSTGPPPFVHHTTPNDTTFTGTPPFLQHTAASHDAGAQGAIVDVLHKNRRDTTSTTESYGNHTEDAVMATTNAPSSMQHAANDAQAQGVANFLHNHKTVANSTNSRAVSMPPPKTRHPFLDTPQVGKVTNKESSDNRFLEQESFLSSEPRGASAASSTMVRNTKPASAKGVQRVATSAELATLPTRSTRNTSQENPQGFGGHDGAPGIAAAFTTEQQPRSQAPGSFHAGLPGKVDQPLEITTPQLSKNHTDVPLASTMKGGVLHKQAKTATKHPGMDSGASPHRDITLEGLAEQGEAYRTPRPFTRQETGVDGEEPPFDINKVATTDKQTRKTSESWNEEATSKAHPGVRDAKRISFSPNAHGLSLGNDNMDISNVVTPAGRFDEANSQQASLEMLAHTGGPKHGGGSAAADGSNSESNGDVYSIFEETSAILVHSNDMIKSLNFDLEEADEQLNFIHSKILRLTHTAFNDIQEIEECTEFVKDLLDAYEHPTGRHSV